jgi:hypothetical protein
MHRLCNVAAHAPLIQTIRREITGTLMTLVTNARRGVKLFLKTSCSVKRKTGTNRYVRANFIIQLGLYSALG